MEAKEKLLYGLIKDKQPLEAPKKTVRYRKHYEFIIGIGKDYIANVTMTAEAFKELDKKEWDERDVYEEWDKLTKELEK